MPTPAFLSLICIAVVSLPAPAQAFLSSASRAPLQSTRTSSGISNCRQSVAGGPSFQSDYLRRSGRIQSDIRSDHSSSLCASKRGGAMARKKSKERGGKAGTDSSSSGFGGPSEHLADTADTRRTLRGHSADTPRIRRTLGGH